MRPFANAQGDKVYENTTIITQERKTNKCSELMIAPFNKGFAALLAEPFFNNQESSK